MTGYLGVKTVPPRKRPLPAPRTKVAKPQPRVLEHVRYGLGKLISVRLADNCDRLAVVKFGDGMRRVLQLRQQYCLSNIASLISAPPVPKVVQIKTAVSRVGEEPDNDLSSSDKPSKTAT